MKRACLVCNKVTGYPDAFCSVACRNIRYADKPYKVITLVPSKSHPDIVYEIRLGGDGVLYCTCKAYSLGKGKACKHLLTCISGGLIPNIKPTETQLNTKEDIKDHATTIKQSYMTRKIYI